MVYTSKGKPIYVHEGADGAGIATSKECCKCGAECACRFAKNSYPLTLWVRCPDGSDPDDPDPDQGTVLELIPEEEWSTFLPPDVTDVDDVCEVAAGIWNVPPNSCNGDVISVEFVMVWRRSASRPVNIQLWYQTTLANPPSVTDWASVGAEEDPPSECEPFPPCLIFKGISLPQCCGADLEVEVCPDADKGNYKCCVPDYWPATIYLVTTADNEIVDSQSVEMIRNHVPTQGSHGYSWEWTVDTTTAQFEGIMGCTNATQASDVDVWSRKVGAISWLLSKLAGCFIKVTESSPGPPPVLFWQYLPCCDAYSGFSALDQGDLPVSHWQFIAIGEPMAQACGCHVSRGMDKLPSPGSAFAYVITDKDERVDAELIFDDPPNVGTDGFYCASGKVRVDLNSVGCPSIWEFTFQMEGCGWFVAGGGGEILEWDRFIHVEGDCEAEGFPSDFCGNPPGNSCGQKPEVIYDCVRYRDPGDPPSPGRCEDCPEWVQIAVEWNDTGAGCADYSAPPDASTRGVGWWMAKSIGTLAWMFPSLRKRKGCGCTGEERRLDRLGPDYVESHIAEEVDRLERRAKHQNRGFNRVIASILLRFACKMARLPL